MDTCTECGVKISDDCVVAWKCPECNKLFKVSFSKLHKIQEWKKKNVGKHLLKCSSCGYMLDNGNEKIVYKCSSCGNVIGGNLAYFVNDENNTDNDQELNTSNSYFDMIECPECRKKILNDSKICSYCGYPLQISTDTRVRKSTPQNKWNINKILISIICSLVLVFLGMIIYNGKIIEPKEENGEVNILSQSSMTKSSSESTNYENGDSKNLTSSSFASVYSDSSSSHTTVSEETIEYYCEADGCYKEGIKAITGLSGKTEYYCASHYQEMEDIISMMEEDVGSGAYSKHKCEKCSKEGTCEIIGLSGATEYYCTEHYNDIVEIINMMTESQSVSSTAFTNKTGTSTTKCAHSGCNNYIASSGDTYYCTTHSKRCGVCGCYIDEDALFCPTCIIDAFTQ